LINSEQALGNQPLYKGLKKLQRHLNPWSFYTLAPIEATSFFIFHKKDIAKSGK